MINRLAHPYKQSCQKNEITNKTNTPTKKISQNLIARKYQLRSYALKEDEFQFQKNNKKI